MGGHDWNGQSARNGDRPTWKAGGTDLAARERSLAALAERQMGVVTRADLRCLGFHDASITHRVTAGRLHRLHRGVYAVGHRGVSKRGRWLAAVLACGPRAALSHPSAAELWELCRAPETPEVTTSDLGRRAPAGVRLYRTRRLDTEDVATIHGVPVTGVDRTLADLAGVVSTQRLEQAIARAEARRILDVRRLVAAAAGRPGAARLRQVLDAGTPGITRSELEEALLAVVRRGGLPRPVTNAWVEGCEVDLLWPAQRLVVEADGFAFHGSAADVERDRAKEAKLAAAGYTIQRFTWQQVTRTADTVIAAITAALDRLGDPA